MSFNIFPRRTIIIFSLFIVVAIFGSIFIYNFSSYTDKVVKEYIEKLTVCQDLLSAQGCFALESCVGIYGPTCPSCNDSEFKYCQSVPSHVEVAIIRNKKLCEDTQGQWYRNEMGNFCLCDVVGKNMMFDKSLGCVEK